MGARRGFAGINQLPRQLGAKPNLSVKSDPPEVVARTQAPGLTVLAQLSVTKVFAQEATGTEG